MVIMDKTNHLTEGYRQLTYYYRKIDATMYPRTVIQLCVEIRYHIMLIFKYSVHTSGTDYLDTTFSMIPTIVQHYLLKYF